MTYYQSMKPKPKKRTKSEVILEEYLKEAAAATRKKEEAKLISNPIFLLPYLSESLLRIRHTYAYTHKGVERDRDRKREMGF